MSGVLFLSRGLGRGHATRDLEIARELGGGIEVRFASYAEGLAVLRDAGIDAIDLGLQAIGDDHERIPKIGRLLMEGLPHYWGPEGGPSLVVADEELHALPVCAMLGIPAIFVTNWLVGSGQHPVIGFLRNAAKIVMADNEGGFMAPQWLDVAVSFVGPVLRDSLPFRGGLGSGGRGPADVRHALGVRDGERLITVTVSGTRLCNATFFRCCAAAVAGLALPPNASPPLSAAGGQAGGRVVAVIETGAIGAMYDFLRHEPAPNVRFVERLDGVLEHYAASDLVITRGGHTTLWELAALGVPAVCVPYLPDEDPLHAAYATNMQRHGTLHIVWEQQMSVEHLRQTIEWLLCDEARLEVMRACGRAAYTPGAAARAAAVIREVHGSPTVPR